MPYANLILDDNLPIQYVHIKFNNFRSFECNKNQVLKDLLLVLQQF